MKGFIVAISIICTISSVKAQNTELNFDTICGSKVINELDKQPEYGFGRKALMGTLNDYSLIPISDKSTAYPVRVKLLVCPNGKFTIAEILLEDSYYEALKVETERLIKLLGGFVPAERDGNKVASYYWIQINYNPKKKVASPTRIIKIE